MLLDVMIVAGLILATVGFVWVIHRASQDRPTFEPPTHVGECGVCGRKIGTPNLWTLRRVHDGNWDWAGGSWSEVDYCPDHRPEIIPTGSTLINR